MVSSKQIDIHLEYVQQCMLIEEQQSRKSLSVYVIFASQGFLVHSAPHVSRVDQKPLACEDGVYV